MTKIDKKNFDKSKNLSYRPKLNIIWYFSTFFDTSNFINFFQILISLLIWHFLTYLDAKIRQSWRFLMKFDKFRRKWVKMVFWLCQNDKNTISKKFKKVFLPLWLCQQQKNRNKFDEIWQNLTIFDKVDVLLVVKKAFFY